MADIERMIIKLSNETVACKGSDGYISHYEIKPYLYSEINELLKDLERSYKTYHVLEENWKKAKELIREKNQQIWELLIENETLKERPKVVRCKDCEFIKIMPMDNHGHQPYWCENLSIFSEGPDWFCADGQKKQHED